MADEVDSDGTVGRSFDSGRVDGVDDEDQGGRHGAAELNQTNCGRY